MTGGAGSFDYLRQRVPDAFTLVCEAPYFFNPAIGDLSESSVIRRDSVLASCDITEGIHNFMRPRFDQIRDLVAPDNNLATAVRALVDRNPGSESKRIWAKTTPECQVPATVAQVFTNGPIARFYAMLGIGMLARAARMEADSGRHTPEQVELLRRIDAEASAELQRQCDIINSEIEYQVVPIWKLVTMQLASALYFIRELKK